MKYVLGVGNLVLTALSFVAFVNGSVDVEVPSDAFNALILYERGSRSGNLYQVQAAFGWMENNFEAVLDNWYLQFLDDDLLNKLLSQPWPIDEIKVFRVIEFLVSNRLYGGSALGHVTGNSSVEAVNGSTVKPTDEPAVSSEAAPGNFNITSSNVTRSKLKTYWKYHNKNLLITNLYLGSLTPHEIQNEVIPSNLISCDEAAETLVRRLDNNVLPGLQRINPTIGRVILNENLLRSDLNARTHNSSYWLSSECYGRNPLLPSYKRPWDYSNNACSLKMYIPSSLTLQMNSRYLVNYIRMRTSSSNRCTLTISTSSDRLTWEQVAESNSVYTTDSFRLNTHLARYFRLHVSSCQNLYNSTSTSTFEIQQLEVSFVN